MLSFVSRPQQMARQNRLVTPYSSPIPGGVLDFSALCLSGSPTWITINGGKLQVQPAMLDNPCCGFLLNFSNETRAIQQWECKMRQLDKVARIQTTDRFPLGLGLLASGRNQCEAPLGKWSASKTAALNHKMLSAHQKEWQSQGSRTYVSLWTSQGLCWLQIELLALSKESSGHPWKNKNLRRTPGPPAWAVTVPDKLRKAVLWLSKSGSGTWTQPVCAKPRL